MSDDRPSPLRDVTKGLGLLFRAARTTISRLPKGDLEDAVVTSAREVGRAIENVAKTIEREVLGGRTPAGDEAKAPEDGAPAEHADPGGPDAKPPGEG